MAREYSFNDPDRPRWCDGDPMPGRPDDQIRRLAAARLAREVQDEQRMARDHGVVRTRSWLTENYSPIVSRDHLGRLVVDWAEVSEFDE